MTALPNLLRAAAESLDDDSPHLILADWLDDHGQPERAELVRTQIALSRLEDDDPRLPALLARQTELLARHAQSWLGGIDQWCHHWEFRRGLLCIAVNAAALLTASPHPDVWDWVGEVRLPEVTTHALKSLRDSPLLTNLAALDLTGCVLNDAGARVLAQSPWLANVRSLNLRNNNIGNKGAVALAASPHVANLRSLVLAGNRLGLESAEALAASPHLADLVALDLDDNSVGIAGIAALLASPHLLRLQSLSLASSCRGAPKRLTALPECSRPASLTRLNLTGNDLGSRRAAQFAASPLLAKLTHLDLSCNQIRTEGVRALAGSPHLSGLTSLRLWGCGVVDQGIEALIHSPYLTQLTELNISIWGWHTAASIRALADWPGMARLTNLAVDLDADDAAELARSPNVSGLRSLSSMAGVAGDRKAAALAGSPHLAGLLRLDLRVNSIGLAGALALASSPYLAGLRRLQLEENDFGEEGAAALRRRFGDRVSV